MTENERKESRRPVLWAVTWPKDDGDRIDAEFVFESLKEAEECVKNCYGRGVVVPLYR